MAVSFIGERKRSNSQATGKLNLMILYRVHLSMNVT
jgi:hypothetical protein